jgi:hypothetical protein
MGRAIMFMLFIWLMTCIAGNMMQGDIEFSRTSLTATITDASSTIPVRSTSGFPSTGIIQIESERIAYSSIAGLPSPSFGGVVLIKPLLRGIEGTTAAAHTSGKMVSTVPGSMMNSSASYSTALIADSAGTVAFVTVPLALFNLLGSFFFLPIQFLGQDLQIITWIWAILGIGVLVAFAISMVGGRRV